jgi:hypothetical protein
MHPENDLVMSWWSGCRERSLVGVGRSIGDSELNRVAGRSGSMNLNHPFGLGSFLQRRRRDLDLASKLLHWGAHHRSTIPHVK